jgi:hypothetical protein
MSDPFLSQQPLFNSPNNYYTIDPECVLGLKFFSFLLFNDIYKLTLISVKMRDKTPCKIFIFTV